MSHRRNLPSTTWTSHRHRTTRSIAMDQARMAVTESWTNTWASCCLQVCSTVYTDSTTVTYFICRTPPTLWVWSAFYFVAVPESKSAVSHSKKKSHIFIWRGPSHCVLSNIFYIIDNIIDKTLTYALETSTLTKRDRKQLNIFERKVYRRILGLVYDNEKRKLEDIN